VLNDTVFARLTIYQNDKIVEETESLLIPEFVRVLSFKFFGMYFTRKVRRYQVIEQGKRITYESKRDYTKYYYGNDHLISVKHFLNDGSEIKQEEFDKIHTPFYFLNGCIRYIVKGRIYTRYLI
jgi:hypothetical protein